MDMIRSSETSVHVRTSRRCVPEYSNIQTVTDQCCNLAAHCVNMMQYHNVTRCGPVQVNGRFGLLGLFYVSIDAGNAFFQNGQIESSKYPELKVLEIVCSCRISWGIVRCRESYLGNDYAAFHPRREYLQVTSSTCCHVMSECSRVCRSLADVQM
jgi:hypothetical protein